MAASLVSQLEQLKHYDAAECSDYSEYLDAVEVLRIVDAWQAEQGWRDIASAPKHNVSVLLAGPGWVAEGHFMSERWWTTYPALAGSRPHQQDVRKTAQEPTHWMPLPDPPAPAATEEP